MKTKDAIGAAVAGIVAGCITAFASYAMGLSVIWPGALASAALAGALWASAKDRS